MNKALLQHERGLKHKEQVNHTCPFGTCLLCLVHFYFDLRTAVCQLHLLTIYQTSFPLSPGCKYFSSNRCYANYDVQQLQLYDHARSLNSQLFEIQHSIINFLKYVKLRTINANQNKSTYTKICAEISCHVLSRSLRTNHLHYVVFQD